MAFLNDPGGTLILDWPFNAKTGSPPYSTNGNGFVTTDTGDPQTPPNVLQMNYPVGFTAGIGPDNIYVGLGGTRTEIWMGHTWMCNAGWQQEMNSQTSKIGFFISNGVHDLFWGMTGPQGGPYRIRLSHEIGDTSITNLGRNGTYNLEPNVATVPIFSGTWYTIEIYSKSSTTKTSGNGIIRWWVNGTMVGNYSGLNYDTSLLFNQAQLSPTWGGANNTKTQNDYYRFGHMRVVLPNITPVVTPPTISSFTPTSGTFGTPITIVGTNFDPNPGGNSVTLNNTPCTVLGAQATQINTAVPNNATTGRIRVATGQGAATSSTDFTVTSVDPPTGTGSLTGSRSTPSNTTLSTEGALDWAHWGLATASDFNHKSGANLISNVTMIGSGGKNHYFGNPTQYAWTGGTPTASASAVHGALYTEFTNNGFRLTAPADTTERIFRVYGGAYNATLRVTATLSDNSAASYTDNSFSAAAVSGGVNAVWTFRYKAGEAAQTLTVDILNASAASGNSQLHAATLQLANPPQEAITLSLSNLTVQEEQTGFITLTINPVRSTDSVVTLVASDDTVISVPGSVTIPANASSASVSVAGLAAGTSTLTATLGSSSTMSTVTVIEAPGTPVSPSLNLYTDFLNVYRWL